MLKLVSAKLQAGKAVRKRPLIIFNARVPIIKVGAGRARWAPLVHPRMRAGGVAPPSCQPSTVRPKPHTPRSGTSPRILPGGWRLGNAWQQGRGRRGIAGAC